LRTSLKHKGHLKKGHIETKNSKFIKMVKLDMIDSMNMKFKVEINQKGLF